MGTEIQVHYKWFIVGQHAFFLNIILNYSLKKYFLVSFCSVTMQPAFYLQANCLYLTSNLLRGIFKEHITIIMTTKEMTLVMLKKRFHREQVPSASELWLFTSQSRYLLSSPWGGIIWQIKYLYLDGKGLWESLPEIQIEEYTLQVRSLVWPSFNGTHFEWSEYFIAYILNL